MMYLGVEMQQARAEYDVFTKRDTLSNVQLMYLQLEM